MLVATAWARVAAVSIALDALVTLLGLIGLVLMAFRVLSLPDDATGREIGTMAGPGRAFSASS